MKQSTFVSGRNIFDGILVVNKILGLAKREKYKDMLLKTDFKRAYDCTSWRNLSFMFIKSGFGVKWKSCMKAIVFPNTMPVLVNRSAAKDFTNGKELRQGDLLYLSQAIVLNKKFIGFQSE